MGCSGSANFALATSIAIPDLPFSVSAPRTSLESIMDSNAQLNPATTPDVSRVGLADSPYTRSRRRLMEIIGDLHKIGVQKALSLGLPRIAVVGSQSVGKSSLIESIAAITLPRDTGTCTRCPMECRLQSSTESWSCTISLRFLFDDEAGVELAGPREDPFGLTLTNPSEVEPMLRRAQRAILSPWLQRTLFLDDSDQQNPARPPLFFSKNCVCIHISGPDVPDLHFYDLPGIIANVNKGVDAKNIALVTDLAQSYTSLPNCVILLVVSCETDFENQGAVRLALDSNPEGDRIVGVLTKPDRIEEGQSGRWTAMIRRDDNSLVNGWFCVKQPDPSQLKTRMSWKQARDLEGEFFRKIRPWSDMGLSHRHRLGSEHLVEFLSDMFSEIVRKQLPAIRADIQKHLEEVEREISTLPKLHFDDSFAQVMNLIARFTQDISAHVNGIASIEGDPGLIQEINIAYANFRKLVRSTAPRLSTRSRRPSSSTYESHSEGEPLEDDSDDPAETWTGRVFYVDEVMRMIQSSRTRELPGNYPYSLKVNLIGSFLNLWESPTEKCFENVRSIAGKHIHLLVSKWFGPYSHGGLLEEVSTVVHAELSRCSDAGLTILKDALKEELTIPYTQNEFYFFSYRSKFLSKYRLRRQQSVRLRTPASECFETGPPTRSFADPPRGVYTSSQTRLKEALAQLKSLGFSVSETDLHRLVPQDEAEPALEIMAEVRAYFQVAFKRFSDVVPLRIDDGFLRYFEGSINQALVTKLGLGSNGARERCERWLAEPPEIARKREQLKSRRELLQAAQVRLMSWTE